MHIIAESACQPYAWFRKTIGFFACLRMFPVCQAYTPKKSISLQPRGWCLYQVNHGWVHHAPPNVNYTRERIYRETEKEQQRGCLYFRCTANHFPSAPTGISRFGFLFLLFACPKKDFAKDIFLIRLAKSRECRPSFRKKSLIIFSSKREKSVEYRVRGTFPEKKFPPTGCKTWKKCGIQGEEVFSKKLFAQTTKKCGI